MMKCWYKDDIDDRACAAVLCTVLLSTAVDCEYVRYCTEHALTPRLTSYSPLSQTSLSLSIFSLWEILFNTLSSILVFRSGPYCRGWHLVLLCTTTLA